MEKATKGIVCTLLAILSGCSTFADARGMRGLGDAKTYDAPRDQVWGAVLSATTESGLKIAKIDKSGGEVLAEAGVSAFSWGEYVAIYVEDDDEGTRVEVCQARAMSTQLTGGHWGTIVHEHVAEALDQADG